MELFLHKAARVHSGLWLCHWPRTSVGMYTNDIRTGRIRNNITSRGQLANFLQTLERRAARWPVLLGKWTEGRCLERVCLSCLVAFFVFTSSIVFSVNRLYDIWEKQKWQKCVKLCWLTNGSLERNWFLSLEDLTALCFGVTAARCTFSSG